MKNNNGKNNIVYKDTQKLMNKVHYYLVPVLNELGYWVKIKIGEQIYEVKPIKKIANDKTNCNWYGAHSERDGIGTLLIIGKKGGYKSIMVQPTINRTKKEIFNLGYPRITITKEGMELEQNEKIPYMFDILKKMNICYLMYAYRDNRFYFGEFRRENMDYYYLTYKFKKKKLDRIQRKVNRTNPTKMFAISPEQLDMKLSQLL